MGTREVELLGEFVVPSLVWSETHLEALCFRCDPLGLDSDQAMMIPVISSVAIHHEDIDCAVRIIGTLRNFPGQHMFEMRSIKRQTEKKTKTDVDIKKLPSSLYGRCTHISTVLHMQFGRTVFLEMESITVDTDSTDTDIASASVEHTSKKTKEMCYYYSRKN